MKVNPHTGGETGISRDVKSDKENADHFELDS